MQKADNRGRPIVEVLRYVTIYPITFEWHTNNKQFSRQQLPIRLRYAITIHKSQEQTLRKAVINIGKSEKATRCTYVAIFRLRSLEDLIIEPMTFNRLLSIKILRDSKRESKMKNAYQN